MKVSVVICAYVPDQYDDLRDAIESIRGQTYEDVETVVIIDGSDDLYELVADRYGDAEDIILHCNDSNMGLSRSRNEGIERSSGDIVAFLDDDAVARSDWIETLVDTYDRRDAIAAGGRMAPQWISGEPDWLPPEFYWLGGVTHRGFGDGEDRPGEVRNTNGSNISFRREVFLELGGFEPDIGGRKGDNNLQGGETELCARLRDEYGRGVYYDPEAEVGHKVFEYRTDPYWLLDRAFWQGYSKRGMAKFAPESAGEEWSFLGRLLGEYVPQRLRGLVSDPDAAAAKQLVWLFVLTGAVGVGYLYGIYEWG